MPVTLHRIHHVGLIVTDIERSMAFYNKLLGQEPDILTTVDNSKGMSEQIGEPGMNEGDVVATMAFYDVDNTSIELIEVAKPDKDIEQLHVARPGSKHLCFQVDDVEETYAAMKAEGYTFKVDHPAHYDEGQPKLNGIGFAYFYDPDGNVLEILEDPNKKGLHGLAQKVGLADG